LDSTLEALQRTNWPTPPGHQDVLDRGRLIELLEDQFNRVTMPGKACAGTSCWNFGDMATLGLQDYGFETRIQSSVVRPGSRTSANTLNCCTVSIGQELVPLGTVKYSGWKGTGDNRKPIGTIGTTQPSCTDGKRPVMWNEEAAQADTFPCTFPDTFSNTEFAPGASAAVL